MKNISVVGAGLVGSLLSIYLAKKGFNVNVFERRPDLRNTDISAGKSINLALSNRGWKALEGAGLGDDIRKIAIPMPGRIMHSTTGELSFQPYGKKDQAIYSVSRGGLNEIMLNKAEKHGAKILFNKRCKSIDFCIPKITLEDYKTKDITEVNSDVVFGTDGAFSAVRYQMQKTDRYNYHQMFLEHGYKELSIHPDENGNHKLDKNALHIWPRGGFMLIALPNLDGSFTVTLFLAYEGEHSFENLQDAASVIKFFETHFADALKVMPHLSEEFFENPTGSLVTVRCYPWVKENKVCLLGDAAHAIVPFYGQGMNSGFEDCSALHEIMEKENDWTKILTQFQKERKPAGDAIADLALYNFIEMRDLVGDKKFLLRKKIEAWFSEKHSDVWIPQYSMVTFSHIPYHHALAKGKMQREIMDKVMQMPDIENKWNSEEVENTILSELKTVSLAN
ncbi:MAG: FAD-dependent monooxygenase [Bacteroidia bacterium]|nr:FAD-dependent monooxygenase [Bacteroidia bacterium]